MEYCYTIHYKGKEGSIDSSLIVTHLEHLFRNKKFETAFTDKIPIDIAVSSLWKNKKTVCLDIKTRSQQIKQNISKLLSDITDKDLVINEQLYLRKPTLSKTNLDCFKQEKGEIRWNTLEHNGPYFKHLYEPPEILGVNIIYDGKEYKLSPKEEEVASFYAKRIITEEKSTKKYLDKKEFNLNFFNDFKTYFTPEHKKIFKDFKKFDFSKFVDFLKQNKDQKEEAKRIKRDSEHYEVEKVKDRISKLERKLNFSYAYVDDNKKEIRNSAVEMPGIYVGSGNIMTNKGKVKQDYYPEDVTINVSKGCIPNPPKGYKWGKVVHVQTANWTARYKDKTTGKYKYILLAETGDLLKFEKARKLNYYIDVVDKRINDLLKGKSKDNQTGCALYLIKEYGIRVGNECEDDCESSEKVVGATTLMVQNVKCKKVKNEYHVELSFKGKDSVSYDNTLVVKKEVYDHIASFLTNKKGTDNVFHEITSNDINKYLKSIDKDFSAKVFRTRLASSMMYEGLNQLEYDDESDEQKIADFNKVNRLVAIKLNHKKGHTDSVKERLKKDQEKIEELKEKCNLEKDEKKKTKIKADIEKKEFQLYDRDESKEIALDTSKKNYIDPRIVKAWVEKNFEDEKRLEKIYTKTHMKHFRWAIEDSSFDDEWDYNDTELDSIVGEDLNPELQV